MKVETIFAPRHVMADVVPLTIPELGFVYLNDIGTWNIKVNWKNSECHDKRITVAQLLDLFEHHARCYWNQEDVFEEERQKMIEMVKKQDPAEWIDF